VANLMRDILRAHHVDIPSDNAFQRRARLLQALWREEHSLPIGTHRDRPLGSRLAMPHAQQLLANYLTETIRACVRREVLDPAARAHKLYGAPRIFDDLLSSQPMCFNIFAELQADLDVATSLFRALLPDRIERVTAIRFEHSPGRGDLRFTGDRSAHDVFVEYVRGDRRGFLGIEVKYHEDLSDTAASLKPRYEAVADAMAIFRDEHRPLLRKKPLQQIWRDHLLAGSIVAAADGFDEGAFGYLYPRDNYRCAAAVTDYLACLHDDATFVRWTLEDFFAQLGAVDDRPWVDAFRHRYLAFERVDAVLAGR
jgi:hypothetical protein